MFTVDPRATHRIVTVFWLLGGLALATYYVVSGMESSRNHYFILALGWAIFGVGQAVSPMNLSGAEIANGSAAVLPKFLRYLPWVGMALLVVGVAARWV